MTLLIGEMLTKYSCTVYRASKDTDFYVVNNVAILLSIKCTTNILVENVGFMNSAILSK